MSERASMPYQRARAKHWKTILGKPSTAPEPSPSKRGQSNASHVAPLTGAVGKEHQCLQCPLVFKRKYDLEQHDLAVHKKLRPHKCDVCQKTFAHAGTLSKHRRTMHEGRKPYACPTRGCSKTFAESGNLNKHVQKCRETSSPRVKRAVSSSS